MLLYSSIRWCKISSFSIDTTTSILEDISMKASKWSWDKQLHTLFKINFNLAKDLSHATCGIKGLTNIYMLFPQQDMLQHINYIFAGLNSNKLCYHPVQFVLLRTSLAMLMTTYYTWNQNLKFLFAHYLASLQDKTWLVFHRLFTEYFSTALERMGTSRGKSIESLLKVLVQLLVICKSGF